MKSTNKILMAILIINTAFVTIKLCIRICNKIAIDIPIPVDRPIYGFPKKSLRDDSTRSLRYGRRTPEQSLQIRQIIQYDLL